MSVEAKRYKSYVRPATREDCIDLAPRLRREDVLETRYSLGLSPRESLLLSFSISTSYAVVWGDEVVAIFGHCGIPGKIGVPWMVASPALEAIRKSFLRECRKYVQEMLDRYGYLENKVWVRNAVHIKWLRWLGFQFDPVPVTGIDNEPFYRFFMKDKPCVTSQPH